MTDDIRKRISVLNQAIAALEVKFNIYFSGREKLPPVKELESLRRDVNRCIMQKKTSMSARTQFLITTFQQRFASYNSKWERMLRDIETGRLVPGKTMKKPEH